MTEQRSQELFDKLSKDLNWIQGEISMYGKKINTPRLQAWMSDPGVVVKGLFQKQPAREWSPEIKEIKEQLESMLGCHFDYLLLNFYRNGKGSYLD